MLSQLVPLLCYILFTALVIVYRKKPARREVMFFLLYIFVPLDGQAIQLNYLVVDDEPLVPQDLEDILKKGPAGVPDILQKSGNNLAVNPQAFDCDCY